MTPKVTRPLWAARIVELRKKLGINQQEFAAKLSVTQGGVSKWEQGIHRPTPDLLIVMAEIAPDEDKIFFLAEAGIPSSYFMGDMGKVAPKALIQAVDSVVTKVLGEDPAKVDIVYVPLIPEGVLLKSGKWDEGQVEQVIPMIAGWLPNPNKMFAMTVAGEGMAPRVCGGDIVLVDPTEHDPSKLVDRIVAARIGNVVSVRWLRFDGLHYMLVGQNSTLPDSVRVLGPRREWSVVGEVVRWIGQAPKKTA